MFTSIKTAICMSLPPEEMFDRSKYPYEEYSLVRKEDWTRITEFFKALNLQNKMSSNKIVPIEKFDNSDRLFYDICYARLNLIQDNLESFKSQPDFEKRSMIVGGSWG